MEKACPCGHSRPYEACCGRFISGQAQPERAEQLMRSRYTAYATGAVQYVVDTELEPDAEVIENWARSTQFTALRVLDAQNGGPDDDTGTVTFEADFESRGTGQKGTHRETSRFQRVEGRWIFDQGKQNPLRQAARTGRNDPCPCGSGKKFKKCCLATGSV